MALQVWLPLNGNLDNQGLSNVNMSGVPSSWSTNGKLGTCATFSGSTSNIIYANTDKFYYTDNFSWSVWLKHNYTGTGAQYLFSVGRLDYSGYGYGIQDMSTDRIGIWFGNIRYFVDIPSDTWIHIAFTKSGDNIKIYKNGDILTNTIFTGGLPTYENSNGLGLGCFHYSGGNIYGGYGSLNDFRIYDHALSPKEVELISRGLVVHYPMNGGGRGGANLFRGTMKKEYVTAGNAQESITMGAGSGGNGVFSITEDSTVPCGNLSWNITGNTTGNRDYQQYVPYISGHKYTLSWYAKGNGTCLYRVWNRGSSTQPLAATNTLTSDWKYYTWTFTATEDIGSNTCTAQIGVTGNSNINICGMKIEEGDKATPWIPHTSDTAYTTMGYNNIEYDTSGYNNHGTINGTVEYSVNTPRYNISTDFNKSGYIINNSFNTITSQFTFNIWVKPKSKSSQHFLFGTFNSWTSNGIGVWRDDDSSYSCLIRSDSESSYKIQSLIFTLNTWNMLTLVYTGTNYLGYLNGILKFNSTYGSRGVINNPVFMIANSKYNNTPASENEEAYISDARFYATALTADQIKELYQSSASIDKNGNMYAYEYNEV